MVAVTNSRSKGKRGELELAHALEAKGYDCRRGQQFKGGGDSPDVVGLPGIHIECKRVERLNVQDALDQAEKDCDREHAIPAVFHRRNREPWKVTMSFDDWCFLYRLACDLGDSLYRYLDVDQDAD